MTSDIGTCQPDMDLSEAARRMWDDDCGCLPVVDQGKAVGVITDRDLCMGAYFQGRPLRELQVGECMSRQLFSCRASDTIEQVIGLMGDHQVRRIPVVDEQGRVKGILSMNDLVRGTVSLRDERTRSRLAMRLVEALASISEAHRVGEAVPGTGPARERSEVRLSPAAI